MDANTNPATTETTPSGNTVARFFQVTFLVEPAVTRAFQGGWAVTGEGTLWAEFTADQKDQAIELAKELAHTFGSRRLAQQQEEDGMDGLVEWED